MRHSIIVIDRKMKKELDKHKIIGLVAMDLSKAFDTVPRNILVLKLHEYGVDDKTVNLIKDYLP